MRAISVVLGIFIAVLAYASVQAAAEKVEGCRAAIQAKRPCMGTRNASPARTACYRAAMERCKANGPGAI